MNNKGSGTYFFATKPIKNCSEKSRIIKGLNTSRRISPLMNNKFISNTSGYYASQAFNNLKHNTTLETESHEDQSINLSISNNQLLPIFSQPSRTSNLNVPKAKLNDSSTSLLKLSPVPLKIPARGRSEKTHISLQNILLTQIQAGGTPQVSAANASRKLFLGLSHRSNHHSKDMSNINKSGHIFLDQSINNNSSIKMKKSSSHERFPHVNSVSISFPKLTGNASSISNKAWPAQPDLYPYGHLKTPLKNESPFLIAHSVSHSQVPGNHVLAEGQSVYGTHIFADKMKEVKEKEKKKNGCSPTAKKINIKFGRGGDWSRFDTISEDSQYDLENFFINDYSLKKNKSGGSSIGDHRKIKNPLTALRIKSQKFFPSAKGNHTHSIQDEDESPSYLSKKNVDLPPFVGYSVEHMRDYKKNGKRFEVRFKPKQSKKE